jgi:mono/diheme cytochrome c family protein
MPRTKLLRAALAAASLLAAAGSSALAQDQSGSVGVTAPIPKTGQEVYEVICQACHMADGKGGAGAGAIPALAGNPMLAAPNYPVMMVLNGRGAMPWFKDSLSAAQVADVVTYIRTHFGNSYAERVTEAEVKQAAQ